MPEYPVAATIIVRKRNQNTIDTIKTGAGHHADEQSHILSVVRLLPMPVVGELASGGSGIHQREAVFHAGQRRFETDHFT